MAVDQQLTVHRGAPVMSSRAAQVNDQQATPRRTAGVFGRRLQVAFVPLDCFNLRSVHGMQIKRHRWIARILESAIDVDLCIAVDGDALALFRNIWNVESFAS